MYKARDEFIHRSNVANFTRLLRAAPEGPHRKVLMSLLVEEGASARANGWPPTIA